MEVDSRMNEFSLLAWGNSDDGQLGLGSSDVTRIDDPTPVATFADPGLRVVQVACGRWHTLFVMKDGSIWSCGNNEKGQLGRSLEEGSFRRPARIRSLENYTIIQAAAGTYHSLALGDYGQVFFWGTHGDFREQDVDALRVPKLVKQIGHENIIQIAAGSDFTYVLNDAGFIFVWGRNTFGQLGLGHNNAVDAPVRMKTLDTLPIKQIAVGDSHALVLSKSGSLYSVGRNNFGQLGLGDTKHRDTFSLVRPLENQRVVYVCCGQEHSAALTMDGGVFTFGSGGSGQLGHGRVAERDNNELQPRKVFELMGSPVTQVVCGRNHTVTYVKSTGKLYGFGLNGSGQIGTGNKGPTFLPVVLRGSWESSPFKISEIFAGGDATFALTTSSAVDQSAVDFRYHRPAYALPAFSQTSVEKFVTAFRAKNAQQDGLLDGHLQKELETICCNAATWNGSFLQTDTHFFTTSKNSGVNEKLASDALRILCEVFTPTTAESLVEMMRSSLLTNLPSAKPPDIECLRIFILLPLFPILLSPSDVEKVMNDVVPFAHAFAQVSKEETQAKVIKSWLSGFDMPMFEHLIKMYKKSIVSILLMPGVESKIQDERYWRGCQALLESLKVLYDCNNRFRSQPVSHETFYIPEITDKVNIPMDYMNWHDAPPELKAMTLSFCNYAFTFDPRAKTLLLQADSQIQMKEAVNQVRERDFINSFIRFAATGMPFNPQQAVFLNLHIHRNNLVNDALNQIYSIRPEELKRPLKVWFIGEEGEDAGGIKKEFFMLLMKDLLNPEYGMFTYYEETRVIYFNEFSFECLSQFDNIGVICGLAIYNGVILHVSFPEVLYKKLLGIPTSLHDLADLTPTVARSLQQLLDYTEDDLESVFMLNFTMTKQYLGENIVKELKPGGTNIAVTQANKKEYVDLYVDYILNTSVNRQYEAFAKGFHRVCGSKILQLFHPKELMAMVCGNENYDWRELEEVAIYKGEYTKDHPVIKMFWKVFHALSLEEKRRFLLFLTGSDRIPILGMKSVRPIIQPMGDKPEHLPAAHTCFNILDLPKYKDEHSLRKSLKTALQFTEGFGLA